MRRASSSSSSLTRWWFDDNDLNLVFGRLQRLSSSKSRKVAFAHTFLVPLVQMKIAAGEDENLKKLCTRQASELLTKDGRRVAKQLVFPLYASGNHWILCLADFETHVLAVYEPFSDDDSRGESGYEAEARKGCDCIRAFFDAQDAIPELRWKRWLTAWGCFDPAQIDSINCGVYVSVLAEILHHVDAEYFPDLVEIDDLRVERRRLKRIFAREKEKELARARKRKRRDPEEEEEEEEEEDEASYPKGVHWKEVPRVMKRAENKCVEDPFVDPDRERNVVTSRERSWLVVKLISAKSEGSEGTIQFGDGAMSQATPKRFKEITECMFGWLMGSGIFLDCKDKDVFLVSFLPKASATLYAERNFLEMFGFHGARSASLWLIEHPDTPKEFSKMLKGQTDCVVPSHDYASDDPFYEEEGDLTQRISLNDAYYSLCGSFSPRFLRAVGVLGSVEEAIVLAQARVAAAEGEKTLVHVCLDDLGNFHRSQRVADPYRKANPDAWFVAHDAGRREMQLAGPETCKPPKDMPCQRGRHFFAVPRASGDSPSALATRAIYPLSDSHAVWRTVCVAACKE